jgi:hypothetical protein
MISYHLRTNRLSNGDCFYIPERNYRLNTTQVRLLLNLAVEVALLHETLWVATAFIQRKETSSRCKLLREYWFIGNPYEFFSTVKRGEGYYRMLYLLQTSLRDSVYFAVKYKQ